MHAQSKVEVSGAEPEGAKVWIERSSYRRTFCNIMSLCAMMIACTSASAQGYVLEGRIISDEPVILPATVVLHQDPWNALCKTRDSFIYEALSAGTYHLTVECPGFVAVDTSVTIPHSGVFIIKLTPTLRSAGNEMIVEATRAHNNEPFSITELDRKAIDRINNGMDLPYVLRFTPSTTITSDAGNGIGYTGMWIRGTDGTRIHTSLNGVPLNDPESQQTFFVDFPDLTSSANRIQIQRGIGTTAVGAGSFGGAIKIETNTGPVEPYFQSQHGVGSFGTFRNTVRVGSGIINDRWVTECRISDVRSQGYIDRASASLQSAMVTQTLYLPRTTFRALYTVGQERTYQSWYGTPVSRLENDTAGMMAHALNNGLTSSQLFNLLNSGRTYNFYEYENEVDQYRQQHAQLMMTHAPNDRISISATLHYTHGRGYFEQFRPGENLSDLGLKPITLAQSHVFADTTNADGLPVSSVFENQFADDVIFDYQSISDNNGQPITDSAGNPFLSVRAIDNLSDLVRRRWLGNHFLHASISSKYVKGPLTFVAGLAGSVYHGEHYGEWVWVDGLPLSGQRYYQGHAFKREGSAFTRVNWQPGKTQWYAEMQLRYVRYITHGTDNDLRTYAVDDELLFANPRVGFRLPVNRQINYYASLAWAGHEPNRNDYVDAPTLPKTEYMANLETGFEKKAEKHFYAANLYVMYYFDQLVPDGSLNDVGANLRVNVPESYRAGIELQAHTVLIGKFDVFGNLTLSDNRIKKFERILYDYSNGFDINVQQYANTHISFSPAVTGSGGIQYNYPFNRDRWKLTCSAAVRYVGKQYLDNTSDELLTIAPYEVLDAGLRLEVPTASGVWHLQLDVLNALNTSYVSNGYTFSYIYGEKITERFYYPQATRHYMLTVGLTAGSVRKK
ncbi:MAG: TonB-dependent receptor plug domain-containing protein [Flavobacteriales bacterium]|nr:TonB-dependent receptor plug domain-containing protein [Flavobacteriales bacterium]